MTTSTLSKGIKHLLQDFPSDNIQPGVLQLSIIFGVAAVQLRRAQNRGLPSRTGGDFALLYRNEIKDLEEIAP